MNSVSPVAFKSTYNIKKKENDLSDYCKVFELEDKYKDEEFKLIASFSPEKEGITVVYNDKFDKHIEAFLKANNITFHKKTASELLDENNIKKRMVVPNKKYCYERYIPSLIEVDTKTFDEAFKKSPYYVGDYKTMHAPERCDGFIKYLKTGQEIEASEVYIRDLGDRPEVAFQDGRHRYAVLRDMGFKKIPVAMNKESFKVAVKYGLLGKND